MNSLQTRVWGWAVICFGEATAKDRQERTHRFFEEATELGQSVGMTREEAHQLVEYVYDRPVGETYQEVGGVLLTLSVLCSALDIDVEAAGNTELLRVWKLIEHIRAKQAAKPRGSALPQYVPTGETAAFRELLAACEAAEWNSLDLPPVVVEQLRKAISNATGGLYRPGNDVRAEDFGLTDDQLARLLSACLKPEEIAGDAAAQHNRVHELVHWFARLIDGNANPKWLQAHAAELAYYTATKDPNRQIDIGAERRAAFLEGVNLDPRSRGVLERSGAIPTPPAADVLSVSEFEQWLNEKRGYPVAEVFHSIVDHYINASAQQQRVADDAREAHEHPPE